MSVLVHSGCYNEITQAGWLVNNRNMSQFWRLESVIRVEPAWSRVGEGLPGCRHSVTVSAGLAGTRELPWISFLRPHHSHGLITSVVLPTNTTTWALRFQHLPLRGTQTFRPQQQLYSFAIYMPWGCRQTSHNKIKCVSKLHDIFISH